jgi:phage shock protein E
MGRKLLVSASFFTQRKEAHYMKRLALLFSLTLFCTVALSSARNKTGVVNPRIDMAGYLRVSQEAAEHREARRLSEEDFIRMSREPGTVVLDARSRQKYDELHVKGAINLSFPDITVESLARTIPDQSTRVLIYCNNNFRGAEGPFPTKLPTASLNLSTYIALYSYGYRNVYELGPLIEAKSTRLELVSSAAEAQDDSRKPASE